MKKQFFDILDTVPAGVDYTTVEPETEINSEQVKAGVLRRISAENTAPAKIRKVSRKKHMGLTLIAAVLAAGILGTISVGAMGGFNEAFGDMFAGVKSGSLYSGGSVNIQNNDKYDVNFLGVTGDNKNAFASMTIRNADGSAITSDPENDYILPMSMDYDPDTDNVPYIGTNTNGEYDNVSIKVPLFTKLTSGRYSQVDYFDHGGEICYSFISDSTIRCIPSYSSGIDMEEINLKGEEMKVEIKELYVYHDVEEICSCTNVYGDEDFDETPQKEADAKIREARKNLKEGQVIVGKYDNVTSPDNTHISITATYYLSDIKKIDLDLTGTWKLNYHDESSKEISVATKTISHECNENLGTVDYEINSVEVSPFSAVIDIKAGEDSKRIDKESGVDNEFFFEVSNSWPVITLKNGEKVRCEYQSDLGNGNTYEETGGNYKFELRYTDTKDGLSTKRMFITPDEIQSIEMEGVNILSE